MRAMIKIKLRENTVEEKVFTSAEGLMHFMCNMEDGVAGQLIAEGDGGEKWFVSASRDGDVFQLHCFDPANWKVMGARQLFAEWNVYLIKDSEIPSPFPK